MCIAWRTTRPERGIEIFSQGTVPKTGVRSSTKYADRIGRGMDMQRGALNAAGTGALMTMRVGDVGTSRRSARAVTAALLAGTVLAFGSAAPAMAQETPPELAAAKAVSVPAGPLTPALNSLAAQTGLQVLFDASLAEGKTTRGVRGTLTPAEALDALLAGTGIGARFAGSNQVLLSITTASVEGEEGAAGATDLAAITIYGARNATTLDATTASVGIVNAKAIENGEIRYTQDAFRRLGNVMDSATLNAGFVIRGMSSEGFVPAGAPAGSLYVDGILQTRYNARFGARSLWDMEQVEVYRGPQSTLSGRAAMVGAVYLKSKDPTFEKEAELSGTVGNNDLVGTAFMVNTPLMEDQIALRISGAFEQAKTTVRYPTYKDYAGYDDLTTEISHNLRAKLLLTPSELPETRALLTYSYSNDRPNERLIGVGTDFDLDDERGDFYVPVTFAEFRAVKVHNVGLEITHDFSDVLRFTSQTGYQFGQTTRRSVDAGTAGLVDGIYGDVDDTLFSQELRLNYDGDRWKWVAGVFGSHQNFDSKFDAIGYSSWQWDQYQNRKTDNLAVFGEATYEFARSWFVTAGGRLDYLREQTFERNAEGAYGTVLPVTINRADFSEVNFVPKLGISKEIGDGHTVGLTYTEGFRTGGFYVNYRTFEPQYYDPEFAQSFELSYKGHFFDDRLMLNANLFYTRYDDQQVEIRPDPAFPSYRETTNAASSRVWGFEIEPTFEVTDQFTAFASIGYLNTKFLTFDHGDYGDLSGEAFPEAPEWTVGLGGRYEFENGFFVGGDAKYTAGYTARFGVAPLDKVESRVIVNSQAGFKKDNFEITAFAENLLDERYLTVVDRDATPIYGQVGQRRSFGLNIRAKF